MSIKICPSIRGHFGFCLLRRFFFLKKKKEKESFPHSSFPKLNKSALDSPSDLNESQFISALAKKSESGHLTTNKDCKKCVQDTDSP